MKGIKNILAVVAILSLCFYAISLSAIPCWSACTGSSPNLTATSASYTDVKACTDIATYGDTVIIPAGKWTWNNTIMLNKDVTLRGAGSGATLLSSAYIVFSPDETARTRLASGGAGKFVVSDIGFTAGSSIITINNRNSAMIRHIKIHNCSFVNTGTSMVSAVSISGDVSGVFYKNTLSNITPSYSVASDDYSWRSNRLASEAGDGWYIEDNTETWSSGDGYTCAGGGQGWGFVCRYNTATGPMMGRARYSDSHGCQVNITGMQFTEIYGNSFTVTGGGGFGYRGGKTQTFFNLSSANSITLSRDYTDSGCFAGYISIPDKCATGNNDDSGQVCIDSIDPGTPCVCQKLNHSYFINNRVSAAGSLTVPSNSATGTKGVEVNREYFNYTGSFDGTAGVGCGPLASRPGNCTTGVGYWATNQSCSDLTGMVGASPSTPISGTLYRCTAKDTWTPYYTPYTYPHPLRAATVLAPELRLLQ